MGAPFKYIAVKKEPNEQSAGSRDGIHLASPTCCADAKGTANDKATKPTNRRRRRTSSISLY